jgi:hypothetical protein
MKFFSKLALILFAGIGGDLSTVLHSPSHPLHHMTSHVDHVTSHHHVTSHLDNFEEIELKTRTPAKSRLDLDPDSIVAISAASS